MKYKALITFIDADTRQEYEAGDVIDTSNMSEERIDELISSDNRIGMPVICEIEEDVEENEFEEEYNG